MWPIHRRSLHSWESSQAFAGQLSAYCFQTKTARGAALIAAANGNVGCKQALLPDELVAGGAQGRCGPPLSRREEMVLFLHICQSAGLTEWQTFGT
jgi:hypothetical protein